MYQTITAPGTLNSVARQAHDIVGHVGGDVGPRADVVPAPRHRAVRPERLGRLPLDVPQSILRRDRGDVDGAAGPEEARRPGEPLRASGRAAQPRCKRPPRAADRDVERVEDVRLWRRVGDELTA